ncbi:fructose-1,6-bisphosphatase 1 isoform X1 [Halyomorpha halys]|uniref:fructose-1,6-bisphosphatase 1 isoform X1 n=1 Tax=Halyomorpha halys TaxID=286706 RepID=UPI0006D51C2E|nr:fructose-1,6-bisphosphatase 1-like isoform X1 [Halyomorpha halys]
MYLCQDDHSYTAKYLHQFDNKLWDYVEPGGKMCRSSRNKKKAEVKPKKETKTTEAEEIPIKNKRLSFTSFLIPICITGEKQDYQLLYCVCALKNALKFLSTTLRKEGFAQLYMVGMKSEVDWDKIKANSVTFTDIITEFLLKSGAVCMVAAHKKELIRKVNNPDAPYIVLVTATDIQLPCQSNLCVGSSWLVFRRSQKSREGLFYREVYQGGRRTVNAGILVNGCRTTIATTFKKVDGIHHFIFDTKYGDFLQFQNNSFLRPSGNTISINEGLVYKFNQKVQDWLKQKKLTKDSYLSRYTGGWLTDGCRILRSGGLLLCPEDRESCRGRVKYLYQALPMAFLTEKAGGKATNGRESIMKLNYYRPDLTSLVLGSSKAVENFMEIRNVYAVKEQLTQQNDEDSDETSTDFE